MTSSQKSNWLLWVPRVLGILIASFITIFAFDVFIEDYSWLEKIVAFLMHLIPTFILLVTLIISWRYRLIGGITYIILGFLYLFGTRAYQFLPASLVITLPLVVVGILFILSQYLPKSKKTLKNYLK